MLTQIERLSEAGHAYAAGRVTGTDVPGILGLSRHKTPLSIWARITGALGNDPALVDEPTSIMLWGNETEPLNARLFAQATGRMVDPLKLIVQSDEYDWLCCSPDARQHVPEPETREGLVEFKAPTVYTREDWNERVPLDYQVQLQIQLMCMDLAFGSVSAVLAPLSDDDDLVVWKDFDRDDEFLKRCMDKVIHFWDYNVLKGNEPSAAEGRKLEVNAKILKALHPKDNGQVVQLSPKAIEAWNQRINVKAEMKVLEEEEGGLSLTIKQEIGDASFGLGPNLCLSYRHSERKGYTVEPNDVRTLRKLKTLPTGVAQ